MLVSVLKHACRAREREAKNWIQACSIRSYMFRYCSVVIIYCCMGYNLTYRFRTSFHGSVDLSCNVESVAILELLC